MYAYSTQLVNNMGSSTEKSKPYKKKIAVINNCVYNARPGGCNIYDVTYTGRVYLHGGKLFMN